MNDTTMSYEAVAIEDERLIDVLVSSIYPGAKRESAAMVIAYCRAAQLDPLQKPVHIVPMKVKTGTQDRRGKDEYTNRDVVMPGIGLYRIQAARTGAYAGQDAPVFGPLCQLTYRAKVWEDGNAHFEQRTIEYPEWAEVTVYRLVGGFRCAFTARERWLENYATAARGSDAPNEMWARRIVGQLVKCAEAQALRKGFPEVPQAPTFDEIEGRHEFTGIDADEAPEAPKIIKPARVPAADVPSVGAIAHDPLPQVVVPTAPAAQAAPAPATAAQAQPPAQQAANDTAELASEGERNNLANSARARNVDLAPLLATVGAASLEALTKDQFKAAKSALLRAA